MCAARWYSEVRIGKTFCKFQRPARRGSEWDSRRLTRSSNSPRAANGKKRSKGLVRNKLCLQTEVMDLWYTDRIDAIFSLAALEA